MAELSVEEINALSVDVEIPEAVKLFKRAGVGAEAMEIVVHGGMLGPGIGSFPIVGALALRLRTMGLMKTVKQLECTMRAYVEEFDLQDKKRSLQAQSPGGRSALQDEARGSSESKVMLGILCEQQVLLRKATDAVATGVDLHNAIMEAQGEAASAVKVNRQIQSKIEKALSAEVSGFASSIGPVAAMNEVTAETWAKLAAATCRSASEGGAPGAAAISMLIEFMDKLQEVLGRSLKGAVQAELAGSLRKAGKGRCSNGHTFLVVAESFRLIQSGDRAKLSGPINEDEALKERKNEISNFVLLVRMGDLSSEHDKLMRTWGECVEKRKFKEMGAGAGGVGGAGAGGGGGKGGGGARPSGAGYFASLGFTHCVKFQHGLCAGPTCPDKALHVLVACKRAKSEGVPPGQKCSKGDACWFNHP